MKLAQSRGISIQLDDDLAKAWGIFTNLGSSTQRLSYREVMEGCLVGFMAKHAWFKNLPDDVQARLLEKRGILEAWQQETESGLLGHVLNLSGSGTAEELARRVPGPKEEE